MLKSFLFTFFLFSTLALSAQVVSFSTDTSRLNRSLMHFLDSLYKEDQDLRTDWVKLTKEKAADSIVNKIRAHVKQKDISNEQVVDSLLQRFGWLGPAVVGFQGSQGVFLIIQHADLAFQKKYYTMVLQAEKDGEILSSNVAIMEDRIAMREGRKQPYGSQGFRDRVTNTFYIYPILEPDHLDERRKARGMPPIKTYYKDWDLETYKKQLPEVERIVQEQGIR